MKAANTKPGTTVARGAMARGGRPTAAMVSAAMGTPTIMLASMCRLVSMGMSWIMSMVRVIMFLSSGSVLFPVPVWPADVLAVAGAGGVVVVGLEVVLVVKVARSAR